jgi:peptidoglycan/LPS O-acetylase OafA/YrhL
MSTGPHEIAIPLAEKTRRYSRHFYSLDALRGLAALSVVFFHWRHFFFTGTTATPFDEARQPLYSLLEPLYTHGWRAVDLFFSLSGFVFYWLYSERVADGTTRLKEFVVLRFSRLYPLYFATLLFVAAGQAFMLSCFGSLFVYSNYDLYHFILNLFFISAWTGESGLSFNGPSWSISVEVFLYALFFTFCFLRLNRWWWLAWVALFGSALLTWVGLPDVGRGPLSFFSGGIAYQIFHFMWKRGISKLQVWCLIAFTVVIWILASINLYYNSIYEIYRTCIGVKSLLIFHKDVIGSVLLTLTCSYVFEAIVFPVTILTLAVCEASRGTLGKRIAPLGDISYSVYLLHFPLQLVFMLGALALSLPNTVFYSTWVMLAFFVILILLSLGSYHFLERPAQKFLRSRLV